MGTSALIRNSARRGKKKLLLFCSHRVAQERFAKSLRRSAFDVVVRDELCLFETPADVPVAAVGVVDCNDLNATLEFARSVRFEPGVLSLVVLLPELNDASAFALLRLGVKGLLPYALVPRELSRAASQVADGGYWVPRDMLSRFVDSILPELTGSKCLESSTEISRREREVLDLLLDNLSNKEIAGKLFVSERTIKFHVSNLLAKFHVQRRADLIVLWMQRNCTHPLPSNALGRTLSTRVN